MGTTLTGTTPQDTYDSLIKVTDNGPLTGSLKKLTDGLGNDSSLSLSTTAASLSGTLAVSGDVSIADKIVHIGDTNTAIRFPANDTITFETSGVEAARVTSAGDVGIGTTAPVGKLHLYKAAAATRLAIDGDAGQNRLISYRTGALQRFGLYVNNTAESGSNAGSNFAIRAYSDAGTLLSTPFFINRATGNVGIGTDAPLTKLSVVDGTNSYAATFDGVGGTSFVALGTTSLGPSIAGYTAAFAASTNLILNPDGGNVGIGVAGAPAVKLDVVGDIRSSTGILFGTDTAAANLLDDYEEGTFTATLVPSTSGSITLSSSFQTALYTKIGRQVTVRGYLVTQSVSSPVGGGVFLRGLPFTANGGGAASVSFFDAPTYAASNLVSYIRTATTQIEIVQSAALVGNDEEYYFTATYFV